MLLRGGESCGGAKLDPGTHLDRFSVKNYTQSVEYQLLRRQDAKVGKIDNLSSRCPKVSQRCPKGVPQGGYACPFRGTWYGLVLVWGEGGGPGGFLIKGKGYLSRRVVNRQAHCRVSSRRPKATPSCYRWNGQHLSHHEGLSA